LPPPSTKSPRRQNTSGSHHTGGRTEAGQGRAASWRLGI
jgi:hypothetical protein